MKDNNKNKKFERNGHKIFWGDSVSVLENQIDDNSVDLIFVDPPYNIGQVFNGNKEKWTSNEDYMDWCYYWIDLCLNKLKDSGSFYFMCSTQNLAYFDIYLRDRLSILSRIVWSYDSSGVQAKKYYGSLYEPILFGVKDKKKYTFNADDILVEARTGSVRKLIDYRKSVPTVYNSKKVPGNVWNLNRVRYRMDEYEAHPSQKPESLMERIISASSNVGDVVLDPFAGTFTTCSVAKRLKRKSIGIELEDEYIKVGLRRLGIDNTFNGEEIMKPLKTYEKKV